jgi:hypothetical protein
MSPLTLLSSCVVGMFMFIFTREVNEAAQREGGEGRQSAQRRAAALSREMDALRVYQAYCALLPALFVQVT